MDKTIGKTQTISGKVGRVIFHSAKSGWFCASVATDETNVTVTGTSSKEPSIGAFWTIVGKFEKSKYGLQFQSMEISESFPKDIGGIVSFLKTIDGVGDVRARRIAESLGDNAIDIISRDPSVLTSCGLSKEAAIKIGEFIASNKNIAEVESVLASVGLGMKGRRSAIELFGIREIAQMIEKNPYFLVRLPRVTFAKVDNWVLRTKRFDANSVERGAAVVAESIQRLADRYGHTYSHIDQVMEYSKRLHLASPISFESIEKGIDAGVEIGLLKKIGDHGIALKHLAEAEEKISGILRHWTANSSDLGSVENVDPKTLEMLTDEQRSAVENAVNNRVSVLTGGPGSGKTFTTRAIVSALGMTSIAIMAPTGKAARRSSEMIGIQATTIHRFIGSARSKIRKGMSYEEVLPVVTLVDETSMVSIELFAELLGLLNRRENARLILVGDVNQLPSIQPGRVLGDVIDSGLVPTVKLTVVKRQGADSLIVKNANRINNGENGIVLDTGNDFVTFYDENASSLRKTLVDYMTKTLAGEGWDMKKDVQVLAGMRNGTLGTIELNEEIRSVLNPPAKEKTELLDRDGKSMLRVGDKVMVTENNYDLGVVNGDQGTVKSIYVAQRWEDTKVVVTLDDGKDVIFENGDIYTLNQSWAITTHKSQGGEFPIALVIAHRDTAWALQRALLYTAITRGKTRVIVFGTPEDVQKATLAETEPRFTRLSNLMAVKTLV